MSDPGMACPAVGRVPPAALRTAHSQGVLRFLPGRAMWSSHDQSNMSNQAVFFPHMYNKKIWLQLLLHPKGNFQNSSPPHLSEMKLSRFLRLAEIRLLILNHAGFHWLHDQDKCLSYLFMSSEMTPWLGNAGDLARRLPCNVDYE